MADINIQKKKPSFWPWVVGIIVAAALIWGVIWVVNRNKKDKEAEAAATEQPQGMPFAPPADQPNMPSDSSAPEVTPAVKEFNQWYGNTDSTVRVSSPAPIALGLRKLTLTLDQLTVASRLPGESMVKNRMAMEEHIHNIEMEPKYIQDSKEMVKTFNTLTDMLDSVQTHRFPELRPEIIDLHKTVNSFSTKPPMLEQKDKISIFFKKANELVEEMRSKL